MIVKPSDRIMIVGFTGSGKSHLLRYLLRMFDEQGVKTLLYDTEREKTFNDIPEERRYRPVTSTVEEFNKKCGEVLRMRNIVFGIESVDLFAPPFKPVPSNLWKLVHWGRKSGIGLIMTSRRIASVHKDPCSQCKHWYIFYTFLPNDIDYMTKFVGVTAEKAKELKPWYFIYWTQGQAKVYSPIGTN